MQDKNNLVLVIIVALVAVVALSMFNGQGTVGKGIASKTQQNKFTEPVYSPTSLLQPTQQQGMMRTGAGDGKCNPDENGACSGSCPDRGKTCKESGGVCDCI